MEEHLIERIRALCARLVEIAPWWAGSWTPVPAEQLRAFERRHRVELPSGYRRLLREVGDHAPAPGRARGRLLGLDEALDWPMVHEWLGALSQPFSGAGEAIELEWNDASDAYADPSPLAGCLPVLDGGCGSTYLLVVTGAERGRVWSFSVSASPELQPTGAEFLAWYLGVLERGMAPLETHARELEALEARVTQSPDDSVASVTLGRELLLRDRLRARALLERAWADAAALDDETRTVLRRAIAELDLLDRRHDRIEAMADTDDDWLRSYAGIAASQAGDHERTIERIDPGRIPVLLRAAAIGHLAAAHAAQGRSEQALELLRSTQASGSNHALAARLRTALGRHEQALGSWRAALASLDRSSSGPRPPILADFIELPTPDRASIEAAIRALQANR